MGRGAPELRASARKIANAMRAGAEAHAERRGPGHYRATITRFTDVDDFELDVHGQDLVLDDLDVTLSEAVIAAHEDSPLDEGDIMVLVEPAELEYSAIGVERD